MLKKENSLKAELLVTHGRILGWVQDRCDFTVGIEDYSGDGLGIYDEEDDTTGMVLAEVVAAIEEDGRLTHDNFIPSL